jgi:uncharacterized membrane protein YphA (DoxX/SURF4 family)
VLLRTAIGWHFLTEGLEKLYPPDGKPFSAEGYLRNAAGPLARQFRDLIPDSSGRERLRRDEAGRPVALKNRWREQLDRFANHYQLTDAQRADAEKELEKTTEQADTWFLAPENADKVLKYADDLAKVEAVEKNPNALESERLLAQKRRRELESTRKELVGVVDGWTEALHKAWVDPKNEIVSQEQLATRGPVPVPMTQLEIVNLTTKWGLTIVGGCLLLGLFTPLAALAGAGFLLLFYFAFPPWPGVPVPPNAESTHYWIVNKNMVEALACLVLASTPNGLWIGLDSLFFGWIGGHRRGTTPATGPSPNSGARPPGSNPVPLTPDRPRGPADPRIPVTTTRSDRR